MSFDPRGEFPLPTPEDWRREAERLLKGAPFDKVLLTDTYEGITLQPIYDAATPPAGFDPALLNGEPGAVREWEVAQALPYPDPAEYNSALRADLMRGQTTALLRIDQAGIRGLTRLDANEEFVGQMGTSVSNLDDLRKALDGIRLSALPIRIEAGNSTSLYLPMLAALAAEQGIAPSQLSGAVAMDPLNAALYGCPLPRRWAWDEQAAMVKWALDNGSPLRVLRAGGLPYAQAGANAVQEVAYAIATAVETLHQLTERGFTVAQILPHLEFTMGLGPQFFAEIAKLRALRMLWAEVLRRFDAKPVNLFLHAATVSWNKTACDPWVNLLRTTTEALAGVLGGADSLEVSPFDTAVRLPDEFSRRLARNLPTIFREESELHRVTDPAGGAHLVEALTRGIFEKAAALLGAIEEAGGMEKALEAGIPQHAVREIAERRIRNAHTRKDVYIGLNMFPNLQEKPLDANPVSLPDLLEGESGTPVTDASVAGMTEAYRNGATIGAVSSVNHPREHAAVAIPTLLPFRVIDRIETLRRAIQAMPEPPKVFLAGMGPLAQYKPRMDFSAGFFAPAGFKTIPSRGFNTPDEAADAVIASGAPIAVLCSTDDTYPDLVPPFVQRLRDKNPGMIVVLAGYPKDQIEAHKAAGIDEFIHIRADLYETLTGLAKRTGVAL